MCSISQDLEEHYKQLKFSKYGWFLMPLGVVYLTVRASAHISKGVEVIFKVVGL